MRNLIDYMYYRCAKAFYRWDGETGITGIFAVSLFISLAIIDLVGIIYFGIVSEEQRTNNKETFRIVAIIIMILVLLLSFKHYRNKYRLYENKWIKEDKRKRIFKGMILILMFMLPIVIPFIFLDLL